MHPGSKGYESSVFVSLYVPFKKSKRDLVFHLFTVYQTVHGGSRLSGDKKLLQALLDAIAGLEPAPA